MKEFLKSISRKHIFQIAIILVVVLGISGYSYVKAEGKLSPGELSDFHPNNQPINGAMSHADLQKDCLHCHAPIHCVEDTKCQECHMDVAESRSDPNTLHGRLPGVSSCGNCHPEHKGKDSYLTLLAFQNVDHFVLTGFSLAKHQENYDGTQFSCTSCHTQEGTILETLDCVTCHAEEDHDYMAAHIEEYGTRCQECHDGKDRMMDEQWFNHEAYYGLEAGHAEVECMTCHVDKVYVGLSTDCYSCHEEPEMHLGVFGTDCAYCHDATAWAPAVLKKHDFVMQHGDEAITECETCHGGTYTSYPCDTCHEDADMQTAHVDVETTNLHDCIACHPTGRGSATLTQDGTGVETEGIETIGTRGMGTVSETQSIETVVLTGVTAGQGDGAAHTPRSAPKKDLNRRSGREG